MQRAYHERCPTAEAYRLHDDDDDGHIYFVGTHVVKRCLRPRSHGSGSRRLKSAAIVCMFHQRSIARSLRSASRWGSICRRLRSAAIALIAADTFHPLKLLIRIGSAERSARSKHSSHSTVGIHWAAVPPYLPCEVLHDADSQGARSRGFLSHGF